MRIRQAALMAGLALGLMSGTAKAAYILNVNQVGTNVVAIGSGSLDLSGLSSQGAEASLGSGTTPPSGIFYIGQGTDNDVYSGVTGPSSFGPGPGAFSSSNFGSYVGISGATGQLIVYSGYQSGDNLGTSTSIFSGTTISDLGLTPGSYVYYLGQPTNLVAEFARANVAFGPDTFTINVADSVSAVPLPASAPMFGAALLALGAIGYGMKRKKAAAAV